MHRNFGLGSTKAFTPPEEKNLEEAINRFLHLHKAVINLEINVKFN